MKNFETQEIPIFQNQFSLLASPTQLPEELQNDLIHLDYRFATPTAGKKRIYTTQDKFEYLANINPALLSLKNKLGLDFDS